jgi:hypothetical protein
MLLRDEVLKGVKRICIDVELMIADGAIIGCEVCQR